MREKVNVGLGYELYMGELEQKSGTEWGFTGELAQIKDSDVEWRRWEAAVAAMQALLVHKDVRSECSAEQVAEFSFKYADALVKKFKEEEK